MAKKGMKRPAKPDQKKNDLPPVPRVDNDLAADNLRDEWDMAGADLADFWRKW